MKPFSLEEYLANPTKKVVTRDGREARIICTDRRNTECPIVALINEECDEVVYWYAKDGKVIPDDLTDWDLFFAPEKHEGWINVYESIMGQYEGGIIYDSEEDAKKHRHHTSDCLATVKIEWEE